MKTQQNETPLEQAPLKKEQADIRKQLGVLEEDIDSASDMSASSQEGYFSASYDVEDDTDNTTTICVGRTISVMSSDEGYVSSQKSTKCDSFVVNLDVINGSLDNKVIGNSRIQNLPSDLKILLAGINKGMPDDYTLPIDNKPDWLDMKKFKIGQTFGLKYYAGMNCSSMLALMILFSFPDGLQTLIFTGGSGTPFTSFRRYLSTVLRVTSWLEHDVWSKGNVGYRNFKAVRAMHLNVSKKLNSISYDEARSQITLLGSSNEAAVWCTLKEEIQDDLRSCCPFQTQRPIDDQRVGKVFVNQLDMSITQFGFVGLMIMYPEKFGAGNATEEELDGFVHMWRGFCYLLGVEDKYNFCNGTLDEVRSRSHHLIDNWFKPNLQHVTEDWEHMSRCMLEGTSYYVPGVSFEVSFLYLCWVLNIPAPRLHAALSWSQYGMFLIMKLTLCFSLRVPGMTPIHNWLIRRLIKRASSLSPDQLKMLESKTYEYERKTKFNSRL